MKNFRKVLALILVVATLFSFVAMASAKSADEYSDYADVKNVEAVDVLTALGVINGYDGAYHPADTIDRDEMAKMVAVLRNAGDFNADLYVTANKFADVKGQWAEGYVAYCAQLGIINGRNATTFDPDAAVKGVEVAKMLLCTLGYDAQKQGYVGANWEVAVIRDATKIGLIPEGVDPYAAATRDEAAQMFLNALKANIVAGYLSENVFTVANSLYASYTNANGEVVFEDISLKEAEKNVAEGVWELAYGNAVVSNKELVTIYGEKLYETAADCFGRPATKWTIKAANGSKLLEKVYAKAASAVITDGDWDAVEAKVYALTGATSVKKSDGWNIVVDGAANQTAGSVKDAIGNGVRVEIYAAAKTVVIINTYIAKVSAVNDYAGTFTLENAAKQTIDTFKLTDVELAKGDYVLYHLCNGGLNHASKNTGTTGILHDVTVVEPVTVDVVAGINPYDKNDAYIAAADANYFYAWLMASANGFANQDWLVAADVIADGAKYELYLDEYGYVKYYKVPTPADGTKYAYVVEGTAFTDRVGSYVNPDTGVVEPKDIYTATFVNFGEDGVLTPAENTATNLNLFAAMQSRGYWDNIVDPNVKAGTGVGQLIKYSVNTKGISVYNGDNDGTQYVENGFIGEIEEDYARYAPVGSKLSATSIKIGDGVYCTSKTVFMIRTKNLDGTYSYKQITGVKNLDATYVASDLTDGQGNRYSSIQYFYDTDYTGTAKYATYVFIDGKYALDNADHYLVLEEAKYYGFQTDMLKLMGDDYKAYDALVDGEAAIVLFDKGLDVIPGTMYTDGLVYQGVTITTAGKELNVYAFHKEDMSAYTEATIYQYKVVDGEVYIEWGAANVAPLAEGAKIYTLSGVQDTVTKEWSLNVYPGMYAGDQDMYAYVYTNAAGTEVTEIYVINADYLANVLGFIPY